MVQKFKLKSGSAVEVSIDHDGLHESWFPATFIRWVSNKLLVQYDDDLDVKPSSVGIHKLRPVPTPESDDWELKTGDKVEAFMKQRWWEGYVREDLGNGSFCVCFSDSKEMVFTKKLLRVHRQWINHNWVPPITKQQLKNYKDLGGQLKRWKRKKREDRISELPDCLLLHIMSFLNARDVVRTCILSKRWKDLCKCLTTLTYVPFRDEAFKKFKSWVLSSRDHSCSLHNLTIHNWIEKVEEDLYTLIQYALFHNLQHLKIRTYPSLTPKYELLPLISASHSLTFLYLSYPRIRNSQDHNSPIFPKSFDLPALRTLHLECVNFVATHNHCADPFLNCDVLNTLVLRHCSLVEDAQVLCISNHTLSNLTISCVLADQFSLSAPNLSSLSISDGSIFCKLLSSTCNLSFLQQVNIDSCSPYVQASILLRWLHVLANVKILKIGYSVIQKIQRDFLSNPISKKEQFPRFVRLESLTVNKSFYECLGDEQIMEVVEHLLQNTTLMPRVDIITKVIKKDLLPRKRPRQKGIGSR